MVTLIYKNWVPLYSLSHEEYELYFCHHHLCILIYLLVTSICLQVVENGICLAFWACKNAYKASVLVLSLSSLVTQNIFMVKT